MISLSQELMHQDLALMCDKIYFKNCMNFYGVVCTLWFRVHREHFLENAKLCGWTLLHCYPGCLTHPDRAVVGSFI